MSIYKIYRGASASLVDIYADTIGTWGQGQADKYLDGLFACFEAVAQGHIIWRPIPAELGVQGYFTRYERHYIYWKHLSDQQIGIVAILHVNMHQTDRLKAAYLTPEQDASE